MKRSDQPRSDRPLIVATLHTPEGFAASRTAARYADLVELRLDALLAGDPSADRWFRRAQTIPLPRLVTVRHRDEGGACDLSHDTRRELYLRFLDQATHIDIELRHAFKLSDVIDAARSRGVGVVLSAHDFRATPSLPRLLQLHRAARDRGADLFKIASLFRRPRDLATLVEFLQHPAPTGIAAMGMGPLGAAARPALALCGSRLNYGFLHTPAAPGQWPAPLLAEALRHCRAAPTPP